MRFPRIAAAQKLQTWLLVTALVAVFLTGVLVVDLTRNLRTVVISEANKTLTNAVKELGQSGRSWESVRKGRTLSRELVDRELRPISYDVLRSYLDVEGGFLLNEDVVGHSFPPYTEPGSSLLQPPVERREVLAALAESRRTGHVSNRVIQDQKDLVLVAVQVSPDSELSAWTLRRIFNFSDSSELNKRLLLVAAMFVSLIAIGTVLRLSFSLQRGFEVIQAGLVRLRTDPKYRLPDQDHEAVATGRFREDLYYRLNVVTLSVPPLRARREDIPLLVQRFLSRSERPVTIRQDALERIMAHDWPGNVRELENVITGAIVLAPGGIITPECIQFPQRTAGATASWLDLLPYRDGYWNVIRKVEARLLRAAVQDAKGNKAEAARILGIQRRLLYEKMAEFGLT